MEEMKNEIESIEKNLDLLNKQIDSIYDIEDRKERARKLDELFEEERRLLNRKYKLQKKMFLLLPPIKSNGIIDLREDVENKYCYFIYLHGTTTEVGNISFRGYHISDFMGDIGYTIFEEYRGNDYAYQALILLSEKLYEDGIPDFWAGVYERNIASVKTLEKYGGKIIKRNESSALLFQCETKKRLEKESTQEKNK